MKIKILLLLLLASSAKLLAQIGFQENIVTGAAYTTNSPRFVKAADIDGDGDLDIVANGRGLNWYENVDGLGNFGRKKVIAGAYNSPVGTSLSIADFDNDGDADVLTSVNNSFTVYKNTNGLGTFQVMQQFVAGINSNTYLLVLPTDMDGDGHVDILCFYPASTSHLLVWYRNLGTGMFGAEQVITNVSGILETSSLLMADLDGDTDQDIILGSNNYGRISWLKNNGNNAYGPPLTITIIASGLSSLVTSDIDHDGDMDIVSAAANDNQVAWYKNLDGLGTFSDENIIVSNATATNAVFVADINNATANDIIYTSTDEIGWLSNANGLGNFENQQIITNKAFGVRAVAMADLDGDSIKDLISASENDDKVAWYKNNGNGNFGRQLVIARSVELPNCVYSGDFDGDNDVDILVNSQNDAKLTWLENVNGIGLYGKEHIITESVTVGNQTPLAAPADIDGDGDLDIAGTKDEVFLWYENIDGQGNFLEHIINSNSYGTSLVRAKDLDGDGDIDLVCGFYSSNKISWYKNLGSGLFAPEQIISPVEGNGSLTSIEIADMDGDNDMDIIGSRYNWDMYFFKNTNGLGNFALQNLTVFASMYAVYPADMDGDGDKDILGISLYGGNNSYAGVAWFENDNGVYEVGHDVSTIDARGESVQAADIDNDGDLDVLTSEGSALSWYANNGAGTFGAREVIRQSTDASTTTCVTSADIDNDNDLDVLGVFAYSGNYTLSKVAVYENLGDLGNTIYGTIRIDTNANGCTNEDMKGRNFMVASDNGSHSFATFTDQNGAYHVSTTAGNFTTSLTSQIAPYFISTPASHVFSFVGMNNTQQADFCIVPVGTASDLNISVYPSLENAQTGTETYYRIVYKNVGTTTSTGTINFEYNNNKLNFLLASQTVASQTSNNLTFDFTNLSPFETRTIDLVFHVFAPPVTNINDSIVSVATITPLSGDQTTEDNSFTLNQTVVGSYDPNDITCLEGTQVLITDADKFLHYIVRFQNTGNANAINVRVENTLDNKLDWKTMQLESLSHNGRVEINDGYEVKFIFDNIHLPPSITDEPHSHGFIAYKIKPLNNVVVGDVVNNTANIYFDSNPPIVTNTASTQFVQTLSVAEIEANQFNVYPNPTESLLNIKGNAMFDKISVIDLNGRILKQFHFDPEISLTQIDLTDLTTGIYFLRIMSKAGATNKKIIKR